MLPVPAKFAAVCLAAYAFASADQDERRQPAANQRQFVIQTLELIKNRLAVLGNDPKFQVEPFRNPLSQIQAHTNWLSNAAAAWRPATSEEGQPLRMSLERIQSALATIDTTTPRTLALLREIDDDLGIKTNFCKALGLSANALVIASTKQDGVKEVKGLEVWYIEKFLAADAKAAPHRFSSFSSPATEQVAPGRYVFWSKSAPGRKTGEKVEQCLCLPTPAATSPARTFRIDLLAP